MIHYITHIPDGIGNNSLGINMPDSVIHPYLNTLEELIGQDDFIKFTKQVGGNYHIPVIEIGDYLNLLRGMGIDNFLKSLDPILKYEIDDLKMLGIGTATRGVNRSYFIVCESEKLQAVRKRFLLDSYDFHITIGFYPADVFGVPKRDIIEGDNKFLKLLAGEFFKNEDWRFIKNIENFSLDSESEIIPINIGKTYAKFMVDNYYINVGYLEDGEKFWIMAKFPVENRIERLPMAEINKIFKNI